VQDAASWSAARDTRLADRLRCPRRQMRQRSWADRLTLAPRKEVVDPLCLRWPGSACHVGHFAPLGEVCPLRPSPPAIQFFSTYCPELFAGLADRDTSRRPQNTGRGFKSLARLGRVTALGVRTQKCKIQNEKPTSFVGLGGAGWEARFWRSKGGHQNLCRLWGRQPHGRHAEIFFCPGSFD
jgi:hypothetical protein